MSSTLLAPFLQGFLMCAGLIVAIGAQNALVLKQGLAREHVGPVVLLCTASDWLLIALGVFGFGSLVQSSPMLLQAFRFGGAAFLIAYGLRSARQAWRGNASLAQAQQGPSGLAATLGSTLAMTYLNPHVYLDTVVLMGSVGAQHPGAGRSAFAIGAGLASLAWFTALGFGASAASRGLRHPAAWRGIDASVAVAMGWMATQLLLEPL